MLYFNQSSRIDAPVEAVWEFHERLDILEILTPPWQPIQVKRRQGGLEVGAESEFLLFFGPVPIRWLARHTQCERYSIFVDEQVEGPLAYWKHEHRFVVNNDMTTQLTDAIAFSLPAHGLTEPIGGGLVQSQLDNLFRYRHSVTQQECRHLASYYR